MNIVLYYRPVSLLRMVCGVVCAVLLAALALLVAKAHAPAPWLIQIAVGSAAAFVAYGIFLVRMVKRSVSFEGTWKEVGDALLVFCAAIAAVMAGTTEFGLPQVAPATGWTLLWLAAGVLGQFLTLNFMAKALRASLFVKFQ